MSIFWLIRELLTNVSENFAVSVFSSTPKEERVGSSEMLLNFCRITRHIKAEDQDLEENLFLQNSIRTRL
jgi:hypothetical protein